MRDHHIIASLAVYLGDFSNNYAEYCGVVQALEYANRIHVGACHFRVDSMLVARQLQGVWACRSHGLIPLYERALHLQRSIQERGCSVVIEHIYREFNAYADSLANYALHEYNVARHVGGSF